MAAANVTAGASTEAFEFEFKGFRFTCAIEPKGIGFLPRVRIAGGDEGDTMLPVDTEPYATAPEARRHCEQQAVRWVDERMGAGAGDPAP